MKRENKIESTVNDLDNGHSEQCTILVDFQAEELQSIYVS